MAFPHTYKNKIELLENHFRGEKLSKDLLFQILVKETESVKEKNFEPNHKIINLTLSSKLFHYKFGVKIHIDQKLSDFNIVYEIETDKVFQIIIAGVVLSAFFSFLSVKYFLIAATVFSFIFYQLNIMINSNTVENMIKKAIGENRYGFNTTEYISEQQFEWMQDQNRCSGCGEYLDVTDVFCPDCGLRVKKGKPYVPYNISKHNDKRVKYHYKNKT